MEYAVLSANENGFEERGGLQKMPYLFWLALWMILGFTPPGWHVATAPPIHFVK
jgi:hypothetical protein